MSRQEELEVLIKATILEVKDKSKDLNISKNNKSDIDKIRDINNLCNTIISFNYELDDLK